MSVLSTAPRQDQHTPSNLNGCGVEVSRPFRMQRISYVIIRKTIRAHDGRARKLRPRLSVVRSRRGLHLNEPHFNDRRSKVSTRMNPLCLHSIIGTEASSLAILLCSEMQRRSLSALPQHEVTKQPPRHCSKDRPVEVGTACVRRNMRVWERQEAEVQPQRMHSSPTACRPTQLGRDV